MDITQLKKLSSNQASEHVWTLVLITLIISAVSGIAGGILGATIIGTVAIIFVTAPLFFSNHIVYLNLVNGKKPEIVDAFSGFYIYVRALCVYFFMMLFTWLWSLLFIVPGIVKSYSYAMAPYIAMENPELGHLDCVTKSKEMMSGNRWRLFCLHVSFIGWAILCAFTLGIGNLWLNPYKNAATAAFYREISGTEQPTIQSPQDNSSVWTEN